MSGSAFRNKARGGTLRSRLRCDQVTRGNEIDTFGYVAVTAMLLRCWLGSDSGESLIQGARGGWNMSEAVGAAGEVKAAGAPLSRWRDLFRKEDLWAIWLGLGIVAASLVLFSNGGSLRWIAVT